jgi:endonuclease/exonuclease/phosphatase family metal-dependent hydrolase
MRVLTLNVWARHGEWSRRREVLVEGLSRLAPDLIAFQEVVKNDDYDQAADLLGFSDYHLAYQSTGEADGTRACIASRWPMSGLREVRMPVTGRVDLSEFSAWAGVAEIEGPEPLLFVNHKPSFRLGHEREREFQAVVAARLIEEVLGGRDMHVVLAGDFDAVPDSAGVRFWRGLQSLGEMSVCYRDAWEWAHPDEDGYTFTPANPLVTSGNWPLETGRRIDYVFVRCTGNGPTLRLVDCRQVFDRPVWASDHIGVVADLSFDVRASTARSTSSAVV